MIDSKKLAVENLVNSKMKTKLVKIETSLVSRWVDASFIMSRTV